MNTHQQKLGRGLATLLNQIEPLKENENIPLHLAFTHQLKPGKFQPRQNFSDTQLQELAQSIKKNGLLQPILVRALDEGGFEILAGERRWRAAQLANLQQIPIIIKKISDPEALLIALIENIQREDLNPLEEAAGYNRLMQEMNYTQESIADFVGKSRSHIANLLRLLTLPLMAQDAINQKHITGGHGRALIGLSEEILTNVLDEVIQKKLSVRETEQLVKRIKSPLQNIKEHIRSLPTSENHPDVLRLEDQIAEKVQMLVKIRFNGQKGNILLSFDTIHQLDGFLDQISRL